MTKTDSTERRRTTVAAGDQPDGWRIRLRRLARRVWPVLGAVLAVLLWWPVGFRGVADWLHLPLRMVDADVVFLGALASGAVVTALVRAPWPRLLVVVGLAGLGWLLSAPSSDSVPYERPVLAGALVAGSLVGMLVGSRVAHGPMAAAVALAAIAGTSPADWPQGLVLAVALALPFLLATRERVAPTVLAVLRVLVVWLVFALLSLALRYGWDTVRPGIAVQTVRDGLDRVGGASWDFLRTQWWTASEQLLRSHTVWFWVALSLAMVVVTVRTLRAMGRREASARD